MNNIIVLSCSSESSFKYLLVFRLVTTRVRVNIMRLHVLSVDSAANSWICVAVTIRMKSGLSKIRGNGRVREPPTGVLHLMYLFLDILQLLRGLCPFLLECSLSLFTI